MVIVERLKRPAALASAALLLVASVVPVLSVQKASAYDLVDSREIKLSTSAVNVDDVTYAVSFTLPTAQANYSLGGMVVDFCSDSPIVGDTCTAPAGFNVHAFTGDDTLALANQTGITDWAKNSGATAADANTLVLQRLAANVAGGTAVTIDLGSTGGSDGVSNPDAPAGTFYARILLFDTTANAAAYTSTASEGGTGALAAGGVALSTANQITVTAKVQERLTFCVYTGANCAAGGSTVSLGDDKGVLSDAGAFVDKNTKYDVSTNATSGVAIRVKGDTLTSGSNTITEIATKAGSATGTEQFGFCTYQSTGTGLTPVVTYNGDNGAGADCTATTQTAGTAVAGGDGAAHFALETANTNTTYGQTFADKTAGNSSTGVIAFLGNISATTEAGIYATTLTFVATGTY